MADIEDDSLEHGSKLDSITSDALSVFSESTSRRGVLAKGGQLFLKLLGVNVFFALLPLDRCGYPPANCPNGTWVNCGQWGNMCNACCGSGANPTTCPHSDSCSGMFPGAHWTWCCCCNTCGNSGYQVTYQDCCDKSGSSATDSCMGSWCQGGGARQQYWCYVTGAYVPAQYRCTVAQQSAVVCQNCNGPVGTAY
jgi:hypothetical protein